MWRKFNYLNSIFTKKYIKLMLKYIFYYTKKSLENKFQGFIIAEAGFEPTTFGL